MNPRRLTKQQILFILDLIRKEYGGGYGTLQAKLSLLLAVADDGPDLPQVPRMTEPTARHMKLAQEWLLKQEEPEYVEGNLGAARIVRLAALLASVEQEHVGLARRLARQLHGEAVATGEAYSGTTEVLSEARAAGLLEEKP